MKKILSLIVLLALALSLCACGSSSSKPPEEIPASEPAVSTEAEGQENAAQEESQAAAALEEAVSPKLFRMTYMANATIDEFGNEELTSENFYLYQDDIGEGLVTDADGNMIKTLKLNENGQIASTISYDLDGSITGSSEHEYDEYGNESHELIYDADGVLTTEWEWTYNEYRVQMQRVMRRYEAGTETQRIEFTCTDGEHCISMVYWDGEPSPAQNYLYVYEGSSLVETRQIKDDGTPGSSATWTRDADFNVLRYQYPLSSGTYAAQIYAYERIG